MTSTVPPKLLEVTSPFRCEVYESWDILLATFWAILSRGFRHFNYGFETNGFM